MSADVDFACHVLIVGGGPAGSATAIALRRQAPQLHTVVIDRQRFPRDKSCGDGIGPSAVARLRELGALHVLDGREPIERLALTSPSGRISAGRLPSVDVSPPHGYVIPRVEFDAALLDHGGRWASTCGRIISCAASKSMARGQT